GAGVPVYLGAAFAWPDGDFHVHPLNSRTVEPTPRPAACVRKRISARAMKSIADAENQGARTLCRATARLKPCPPKGGMSRAVSIEATTLIVQRRGHDVSCPYKGRIRTARNHRQERAMAQSRLCDHSTVSLTA